MAAGSSSSHPPPSLSSPLPAHPASKCHTTSCRLSPVDTSSPQPIRKLAEDAIYVSSSHPNPRAATDWAAPAHLHHTPCWPLRDPSLVPESPQTVNYQLSPSSPYPSWPPLPPPPEDPSSYDFAQLVDRDPFAAQLWQLYAPTHQTTPTTDPLENLVRPLTQLGLDVHQIRQTLNSRDWKDGLPSNHLAPTTPSSSGHSPLTNTTTTSSSTSSTTTSTSSATSTPITSSDFRIHPNQSSIEPSPGLSEQPSRTSTITTTGPQPPRLSKIDEDRQEPTGKLDSFKTPSFNREPSLERGRRIDVGRRTPCNLAGRWWESTNINRSPPPVSDMDWKAHSRSASRTHTDWRQGSRSRSRLQDFRPDLLAVGHQFETELSQRFKPAISTPGAFEPPHNSLFPELESQQAAGTFTISNNEAYHHGLIQQLIGSYQAQQSEENGLQSWSEKHAQPLNFEPSEPLVSSCGLFQSSSSIPLSEFEVGSWRHPIKPSQHSLLGSIPGLTQDFADLANAHAEYGYIPRLVRKTSFDEILAQQHHPKRPAESRERSPTRLDNLTLSTSKDMVRPNTATDSREGQYRMGLDASTFEKQPQTSTSNGSTSQPDFFDFLSSAVSQSDSNGSEFKNPFQSSRLSSSSSSSDDHLFQGTDITFPPLFEADSPSVVDRITPYDILTQFDHFDSTPVAHNSRNQWLQDSVILAAVQPSTVEPPKNPEVNRLVSSPSSTSSSSEASSRGGLALRINTANAQAKMSKKLTADEAPTKISFSGGRSNHTSSIGEARKRTKQLPYSSGDLGNNNHNNNHHHHNNNNNNNTSSSNGQANSNLTQCLNCQTTHTPLWRRDSEGNPLCNACGLFVNLHGTPRPAALSTGIIKRRNRGKNREKTGNMANSSNNNNKPTFAPVKQLIKPLVHNRFPNNHSTDQTGHPRSNNNHYPPQTTSL